MELIKEIEFYCGNENHELKSLVNQIIFARFTWLPYQYYDDMYSLAGSILDRIYREEIHFDASKGASFKTFLVNVLTRKIKTHITYMNRKKRGGGVPDISIDASVESGDKSILDIVYTEGEEPELSERVCKYLNSLTPKQRVFAELIMQGYEAPEIKRKLNLTDETYSFINQRLKSKSEKYSKENYYEGQ